MLVSVVILSTIVGLLCVELMLSTTSESLMWSLIAIVTAASYTAFCLGLQFLAVGLFAAFVSAVILFTLFFMANGTLLGSFKALRSHNQRRVTSFFGCAAVGTLGCMLVIGGAQVCISGGVELGNTVGFVDYGFDAECGSFIVLIHTILVSGYTAEGLVVNVLLLFGFVISLIIVRLPGWDRTNLNKNVAAVNRPIRSWRKRTNSRSR